MHPRLVSFFDRTKMDEARMIALVKQYGTQRILVNSAADWGVSDALKVPKTAQAMRDAGVTEADIEKVVWHNPLDFYAQSGRIDLEAHRNAAQIDQTQKFEGNSVLRGGQTPVRR